MVVGGAGSNTKLLSDFLVGHPADESGGDLELAPGHLLAQLPVDEFFEVGKVGLDAGSGEGRVAVEGLADEGFKLFRIVLQVEPTTGAVFSPECHVEDVPTFLVNDEAVNGATLRF